MTTLSRAVDSRRMLQAYRSAARRNAVTLDDGTWMRVGMALEHAALLGADEREAHLAAARATMRHAMGETAWRLGHATDPHPPGDDATVVSRIRVFCETIEDAGAIEVSDAILAACLATGVLAGDPIECARIESVRARLAWKRGDLACAQERYRRVALEGRRHHSDELRARALIGESLLARLRGNFPASRTAGRRALLVAERAGLPRLASIAHQSLMVGDAVSGDFASAIEHAWNGYLKCADDSTMSAAALGAVAQLFLDAGHAGTAIQAFEAALRLEPPARIALPALGGLAVAAAHRGEMGTLARATRESEMLVTRGAVPYDAATAMMELARAHVVAGVPDRAEAFRCRAASLAGEFHFHEIAHHAEQLAKEVLRLAPSPRTLSPVAATVAGAIRELAGV